MADRRLWVIQKGALRPVLMSPNAQLSFFTAGRECAFAADPRAEAADRVEDFTTDAATAAEQIAHRLDRAGQPEIAAADDPAELRREPRRLANDPRRLNQAPCSQHLRVEAMAVQSFQPIRRGDGVVVKEGD